MAEFLSLGPNDPNTAMWMRDAVKSEKKLPKFSQLEDPRFFPYRYGQALLAYIAGRWGDGAIGEILKQSGKSGNIDRAIRQVLHVGPDTLVSDWHKALHEAYDPLIKTTEARPGVKPGREKPHFLFGKRFVRHRSFSRRCGNRQDQAQYRAR
jgi:hypothetical protein